MALVPLGTGNDFARALEMPLDPAEAARAVLSATERRIDLLVEDDGEVVVNAVHIGVGVDAAQEATGLKARYGRLGYVLGAIRAGWVSKGQRLRVVVDDRVVANGRHHVLQVAVGNGRFVGGGTPIAPEADPSDGEVDVVLSYALAPLKRFAYGLVVRLGLHSRRRDVETYRGSRVTVTGPAFRWNIDGELKGPDTRRSWTVEPGAALAVPGAAGVGRTGRVASATGQRRAAAASGLESARKARQRPASSVSSISSAARASAASARRKPRLGACAHGTGPCPFQPLRRSESSPRW